VTGCTRLVSLSNLYIETGWKKLKDRREKHSTIQGQNIAELASANVEDWRRFPQERPRILVRGINRRVR
jgi:hypothetical protein